MKVEINWTTEKKKAVIKKLEEWIIKHEATLGEIILQSDECIITAPELLSDLVDDIIKPIRIYEDGD